MTNVPSSIQKEPAEAPHLTVSALNQTDATAEFALARLWRPELDEVQWQSFLHDWRADPDSRGILSARNQRGGVLGFVPWWRQPDLEYGETLWAGPFVVRELGVRPLVRDSLMDQLKELAEQSGARLRLTEAA